jgi:hypothetical protein
MDGDGSSNSGIEGDYCMCGDFSEIKSMRGELYSFSEPLAAQRNKLNRGFRLN